MLKTDKIALRLAVYAVSLLLGFVLLFGVIFGLTVMFVLMNRYAAAHISSPAGWAALFLCFVGGGVGGLLLLLAEPLFWLLSLPAQLEVRLKHDAPKSKRGE